MSVSISSDSQRDPLESHQPLSGRLRWHKSAPRAAQKADLLQRDGDGWRAWAKYLANRSKRHAIELFSQRNSPLLWAASDAVTDSEAGGATLVRRLHGLKPQPADDPLLTAEVRAWLAETCGAERSPGFALEFLAWCHAAPVLASRVEAGVWWELLERLLDVAEQADTLDMSADPSAHQLLAAEAPLTLAHFFAEIKPCRRLVASANENLNAGLDELLDGDGLPGHQHFHLLRPLLACWTRCRALSQHTHKASWSAAVRTQYDRVLRHACRYARRDGSQMLLDDGAGAWNKEMFDAATQLNGVEDTQDIARLALPGRDRQRPFSEAALPEPADNSEWSCLAMLRSQWSRTAPKLAVNYGGATLSVELNCGRQSLLAGDWPVEIEFNGEPAQSRSPWKCVCWEVDDDVAYLELEMGFSHGMRLQRQMLLAREDTFLFVGDAVLGQEPGRVAYRSLAPLAAGIEVRRGEEMREVYLADRKRRALVLPLGLDEWRQESDENDLRETGSGLQLQQHGLGLSLFAPWFFDLDAQRLPKPCTWRRLTVAETRHIQPPDVAVGFRVHIASEQWLIYRSLAPKANRTVLGANILNEFLFSRFLPSGEYETLLEIE